MFKLTKLKFEFSKRHSELVCDFLSGIGAISVAEDFIDDNKVEICAYFPESSDLAEIRYRINTYVNFLVNEYGDILYGEIETESIDETSWQAWKEILKTVKVNDKIIVKPPWEDYSVNNKEKVIEINPSMAFGTGHHESTRLCIRVAQDIFEQGVVNSVLDIGCGSGILSITAFMLGAKMVTAIDIDPVSVEETHKNMERNNIHEKIDVRCCNIHSVEGQYDLILANVYVEPLMDMKHEIKTRLNIHGKAVLSGFQDVRKNELINGFQSVGFEIENEYNENDWVALIVKL